MKKRKFYKNRAKNEAAVREYLSNGIAKHYKDIAKEIGMHHGSIYYLLKRMPDIINPKRGLYALNLNYYDIDQKLAEIEIAEQRQEERRQEAEEARNNEQLRLQQLYDMYTFNRSRKEKK